ncbi:ABC transporter permease [Flavitalea flava]
MFKNYLKVAIRNLLKRKVYTLINILGLATGMAVCMLIILFIGHELSYDHFQGNGDRIYRVVLDRKYPERTTSYAIIPSSIGGAIRKEFPEVEASTGLIDLVGTGSQFVQIGERIFEEKKVFSADSNFFCVFNMGLLEGDTATALRKPNAAILNERTAKKYFGSAAAAIGRTFETDGQRQFMITGICRDWPENSHMQFDMLLSASSFPFLKEPNYTGFSTYTYLLVRKNISSFALEAKFPTIIEKYVSGDIARNFGETFPQFLAAGNGYHYYLQPLQQIHLTSDLEAEIKPNGSKRSVTIFGIIAIFILGIACINFINLSTARSVERAKEVGIRKTFGSEKRALILQFLLESVLVSLLSVVLAVLLVLVLLPLFNRISGKELSLAGWLDPLRISLILVFALGVGLMAGFYPAFVLSSFQPIKVLKGKFQSNKFGTALRNGLVVFQFAISIILIICTIVVNSQMRYMLGDKLGFRRDHIIEIERTDLVDSRTRAFRNELSKISGVEAVSGASTLPGGNGFQGITFQQEGAREPMTGRGIIVDDQFASTLGLELKEGRFFSAAYGLDSLSVVLNERAVKAMGLKDPVIGSRLNTTSPEFNAPNGSPYTYTVVGVIRDFHFQTLHQAIAPLVFANAAKFRDITPVTSVRIKGEDFRSTILAVEQTWKQFVPKRPFHYSFLDQNLASQYKAEQTIQRLFTIFSFLAIFIACIGLLGLAAYATQQRIREISIRKVLGAHAGNIVVLLSRDFMKLVILSAIVAFPLAWLAMHNWLQGFAYRVTLSWWIFAFAGASALLITLLTISFQAIKAALANPVRTLRAE